ncbi:glycine betaine ABC transporter substrate-binding protein [Synechocystis salina]|uniref:ABC transporter permease subunit n=2 Tax=Synechocystis TaxID=1142 RepID=A0ABR9VVQ1_9SYNC|nr:glycine betaine ABC transporter substrate-binding protein [Synechocystis salina]MBE9242376.1 ABC transporter permease subunit [Synechocystis salina LEGE 00041]MBE9255430.1 ABC transporter permease subunit [Synechocystis salina LEGE 00031]
MTSLINLWPQLLTHTQEHIQLVAIAMTVAVLIGIPLGVVISRVPRLAQPILIFANAAQTIPSLAMFGFLITVPFLGGIGPTPAIVALVLYALLPLIRNTYTGLQSVDPELKEAALALGMTPRQVLIYIELPLALTVILAGVRVATVICVGIATIAAAIGGGGLGVFIFQGISLVNNQLILAGAIPAALIALVADWAIGLLEKQLSRRGPRLSRWQRNLRWGAIGLGGFLGLSFLIHALWFGNPANITIGAKNFTEQYVLGELLAQQIENKTDLTVNRRFNLGGTNIAHEAVKSGAIAGYVEYTGTAYTAILKQQPISNAEQVFETVKTDYARKFQLTVFPSLGFENTFALIVRPTDAQRYGLKTISDLVPLENEWQAGFGYEFLNRPDGYSGLSRTYGLKFAKPPIAMDLGLIYTALTANQVDLVAGNSTDGQIFKNKLIVLEDNKRYFPPYYAVPIFNDKILKTYPQLRPAINELAGILTATEIQQLNLQMDEGNTDVTKLVQAFLQTKGLI